MMASEKPMNCAHCGKFIEECQGLVDPCDWDKVICHRHICPDNGGRDVALAPSSAADDPGEG